VSPSPPELDHVVMRGMARSPEERFTTARDMALELERALGPASARAIGDWVEATAGEALHDRAKRVEEMESEGGGHRSSDGSLRRQLARLGFDARASTSAEPDRPTTSSSELPTEDAQGRIRRSDTPAPPRSNAEAPATAAPLRRSPMMRGAWIAATTVAVGGAVAFALAHRSAPLPPAAPIASSIPSASVSSAADVPPASAAVVEIPPPPREDAAEARVPPSILRKAPVRPTQPEGGGPVAPDCDPPYTVGPPPDFIRRPKIDCLPR
jgi:hypothetical protein